MNRNALAASKYRELMELSGPGALTERHALVEEIGGLGVPVPRPDAIRAFSLMRDVLRKPGVVLIGSAAFENYCGMKGLVDLPAHLVSTRDIDIACVALPSDRDMLPASTPQNTPPYFLPGNRVSIDFVVPDPAPALRPVNLVHYDRSFVYVKRFGSYAHILPAHAALLLVRPIAAVIPCDEGQRVRVPDPVRFALHKLVLSEYRRGDKVAKDIEQAATVLTVFADRVAEKPDIIREFSAFAGGALRAPLKAALAKGAAFGIPRGVTRLLDAAFK